EIERGRIALDVRIRRQDDLANVVPLDPGEELAHIELVGTDPVEWRQRAQQHVIATAVLSGPLHRHEVVRLLDDAQQSRVAAGASESAEGSASVTLKQREQWTTGALTSMSASARSWTLAVGCFRRWKASRWAVLGPMPGRR